MLSFKFIWSYVDKASVVFPPPLLLPLGTQSRLWMWSCLNGIIHFSQNDSTTDEDDDGDDDDDEEVVTILPEDKYRMGSLEKMISVMALLVEESRGER